MCNKYKIGDKVRVRKDLVVGRTYGTNTVSRSMSTLVGRVVTITKLDKRYLDRKAEYCIKESSWNWTEEMFEPVENNMTKEEWLKALIDGAIGIQSGNLTQRWRYIEGGFMVQHVVGASWEPTHTREINNLSPHDRTFSLVSEVEMTIEEIEEKLGITGLKIVGNR